MNTGPSATILVIDDNPAGRYATSRVLRSAGFTVLEAATGSEGLSLAPGSDLIVLDVNLPDISGFEVCRRIRSTTHTSRVPVLHLSATFVKDADKVKGLEAGADGYLTHPVEPPVLIATVNAFLRARRAEHLMERLLASERAAREEAERANRLKDEFLATLSHELRTPLNAIVGWSQVLKEGQSAPEDITRGIDSIYRNARSQAQLIADLLDVSRIISGKFRLEMRLLDPGPIIRAALETLGPTIRAKGLCLQQELDGFTGLIEGDPERIQQIIWNLVSNAIKFTPGGGKIHVKVARQQSRIVITVQDGGQGIKPEFLPHIFERFRQEDATTKRNQGGLGLGLAIVKHLVDMHGGTIVATSEGEGRGACFVVQIPVASAPPESLTLQHHEGIGVTLSATTAPVTLHGIRVLVVDDEDDARQVLRHVLGKSGAEVVEAVDVPGALALLPEFKPHVLISDVGIPQQDGYDLIRAVRARGITSEQLPAIALTAFARDEDQSRTLNAGFQIHLPKPAESTRLLAAVFTLASRGQ